MSEPFSDPVVDKFLMKLSLIVGIIFTIGTLFAVYFKAHSIVMTAAFGAGAFLMLAAIGYLGEVRLEDHQRKISEEERLKKLSVDEQLSLQMKRMRELLAPSEREQKSMLKHAISEIEKERNDNS